MQSSAHKAALCDPTAGLSSVHRFINHVLCMLLSELQCHLRQGKHWERNVACALHTSTDNKQAEGFKRLSHQCCEGFTLFLKLLWFTQWKFLSHWFVYFQSKIVHTWCVISCSCIKNNPEISYNNNPKNRQAKVCSQSWVMTVGNLKNATIVPVILLQSGYTT